MVVVVVVVAAAVKRAAVEANKPAQVLRAALEVSLISLLLEAVRVGRSNQRTGKRAYMFSANAQLPTPLKIMSILTIQFLPLKGRSLSQGLPHTGQQVHNNFPASTTQVFECSLPVLVLGPNCCHLYAINVASDTSLAGHCLRGSSGRYLGFEAQGPVHRHDSTHSRGTLASAT